MDDQTVQKYQQLFLQSTQQYLQSFNVNLNSYLRGQTELAAIEQMFIAVHSIRSQSLVMGYKKMGEYCTEAEKLLRAIKDSSRALTGEQLDYLQSLANVISIELQTIAASGQGNHTLITQPTDGVQPINKKILLVEDDRFFQQFYAFKLRDSGFVVDVASNGDEGIKLLQTGRPNLVLLDLIMPLKNGFELLIEKQQIVDASIKNTPVIVFSTLGQDKDIQRARDLGAIDYVNKSFFDFSKLLIKINSYLK